MKRSYSKGFQADGSVSLTASLTMIEFTPPKISTKNKYWYVWYRAKHPITGKWKLFIHKEGINKIKSVKKRTEKINQLRAAIEVALKNNLYNPFRDESVITRKKIIPALEDILEIKKSNSPGPVCCSLQGRA